MSTLTQEQKQQLTSIHLKAGTSIEIWLIPFAITISLLLVGVIVMVSFHFYRQFTKSKNKEKKDYKPASTDSDEAFAKLSDRNYEGPMEAGPSQVQFADDPIVVHSVQPRTGPFYDAPTPDKDAVEEKFESSFVEQWGDMPASTL